MAKHLIPRIWAIILSAWRFLQSPRLLFYLLPYFMILLSVGTLAQKYIGLFSATHLFFNSFFVFIGPVPVPAGASVIGVLFLNLLAHFISSSKWSKPYIGSTLAHLSILVLLLGGAVTLFSKQEGFMLLQPDQTATHIFDYHQREIVLYKNDTEITTYSANQQQDGNDLATHKNLPFSVTLKHLCKNCILDENGALQSQPSNPEDEVNQWGGEFLIKIKNETETKSKSETIRHISVTEFLEPQEIMHDGNDVFFIGMRRHSHVLPFALRLDRFTPTYYPGTDIAQRYESAIQIIEQPTSWPALISMNDPLRYKGYTFYQASFLTLPNNQTASVLNVVKNVGWLFPYLATFLLCAGLLIHLGVRRHAPH